MDLDRYIGLPYSARHMDCADLALLVQRELFGREVALPGKRPRPLTPGEQAIAITAYCGRLADPVDVPADGDAVLMRDAGSLRAGHLGTYFFVNHAPCVLHTSHALGASVLHRLQDLRGYGLAVDGYYRWRAL